MVRTLMGCVRKRKLAVLKEFLANDGYMDCTPQDELEFFKKAPEEWIKCYFEEVYVTPECERVLIVSHTDDLFEAYCSIWPLDYENLLWTFKEGKFRDCVRVLSFAKGNFGDEVEEAMLLRNDTELLSMWLARFPYLSESGERLLEEKSELQGLKSLYIEQQIKLTEP